MVPASSAKPWVSSIRARGWSLTVLVRDPQSAPAQWIARQGATLVRGDVAEPAGLPRAMQGSDVVMHNAGVYDAGRRSCHHRPHDER